MTLNTFYPIVVWSLPSLPLWCSQVIYTCFICFLALRKLTSVCIYTIYAYTRIGVLSYSLDTVTRAVAYIFHISFPFMPTWNQLERGDTGVEEASVQSGLAATVSTHRRVFWIIVHQTNVGDWTWPGSVWQVNTHVLTSIIRNILFFWRVLPLTQQSPLKSPNSHFCSNESSQGNLWFWDFPKWDQSV